MSGIGYVWVGLGADDDWADAANWSTPGYSGPPAPLYPYDNIPPSSGPWTFYSATISDATVTGSGGADQLVTTDVVFDGTFSFGYAGAWGFASSLSGTLEVSGGSVTQSSDEALSTGATLQVDAGATYAIAWGTLSGGAFINNGTVIGESTIQSYINSSDSVVSEGQIFTPFTNNGTLTIDAGDQFLLASDSSNSAAGSILDGTIDGAGTLTIAVNVTLDPTTLTVGAIDNLDIITLGGDLTYGGALTSDDTINLDDYSLTLTGSGSNFAPSYLGAGTVYGGTLLVKGSAEITDLNFGSPASASDPLPSLFEDAGSITETVGGIGLGVSSELLIDSGASYTLTATASLYATNTGASIINNGTLTDADATDGTSTIAGSFTNNGTLHVDAGDTLELTSGGDTLDGAITGAGTLELYKTSASLDPTALGVAAITLTNADITLQGNRTYAGVLTTSSENGGTTYINLGGYKLTLSGSNNVFGYQTILDGPGDLKVTGAALLPASYLGFTINPGAEIEDAGQITDGESFIVSGGELLVDSGGTFELDEAVALYSGGSQYGLGAIVNNGIFVDASEGGTATVEGSFTNNGTLTIDSGDSLSLVGGSATLGGAITGAGTMLINEATTLETTSLTVATLTLFNASTTTLGADVSYGGAFNFDTQQAGASLALAGHTLTLSGGGTFYGANNWGGGEILITGSATFLSGADSGLGFGSSTGSLVVAGQADFNGSGHLYGSITVDAGASVTIAGQIWGANAGADIDFDGANATLTLGDLSSGYVSAFSIAGLGIGDTIALDDVTANGAYINGSNQLVVNDDGTTEVTLQLSGSYIDLGFATIATSSGTELIALPDPATVADYESYVSDYDQITGGFAVSDSASAIVAALKTLDADPNISSLDFSSGSASLKSGASLSAPAVAVTGTGTALTIAEALGYAGNLTLGAGARVTIVSGESLTLSGANTVSGAIGGAGALALTGGDTTFKSGATLTASSWSLSGAATTTLAEALAYSGAFSAGGTSEISLTSGALTLKGATTLDGVTVTAASAHDLTLDGASFVSGLAISGKAIVANHATATLSGGSITIGDGVATDKAEFLNVATGILDIADGSGVVAGADPASLIDNAGLLEKTGAGDSTIATAVTNAGQILVSAGTLDFEAAVKGTGTDTVSGAATLEFDAGAVAAQTIDFTGADSVLYLGASKGFAATLSGFDASGGGSSDAIELLGDWTEKSFSENGTDTLATLTMASGTTHLALKFAGDYSLTSFNISQSGGVTTID